MVYYCCRVLGVKWRSLPYKLLGDDIVIKHLEVGNLYISVIRSLGVEVSEAKTHKSKHFFEFAKRYFYFSKEITHFPISAMKESGKRYYLLTNLLYESENKEWITADIPSTVFSYYRLVKHHKTKSCKIYQHYSNLALLVLKYTKGFVTASDIISYILSYNNLQILYVDDNLFKRTMFAILRELFEASDPKVKPGKPLGLLAEQLVCHYTGQEDFELGFNLVMSDPILNC